ncbi:IS66 family insertion sequence element accessory protein TnpB [Sorangium sp. So ce1024]|uniref:IS66 family insertion sequence element accessory protein TnpB n=1 Tax=Sorangium sp. So ce1024 TaxID=3133327 RepID=UPI003F08F594
MLSSIDTSGAGFYAAKRLDDSMGVAERIHKRRNRLKALWWDRNGYTILYKRLSKGAFALPSFTEADGKCIELSAQDFAQLLAGLPVEELASRRRMVH